MKLMEKLIIHESRDEIILDYPVHTKHSIGGKIYKVCIIEKFALNYAKFTFSKQIVSKKTSKMYQKILLTNQIVYIT